MKTIIFLTTRQIRSLSGFIRSQKQFRYVLVTTEEERRILNTFDFKDCFQEIYWVSYDAKSTNVLKPYQYAPLVEIVEKEISLLPSKENIRENLYVFCHDEGNVLNAGKLRKKFNLQGESEKTIKNFRNKVVMKNILEKKHLRVPKHTLFDDVAFRKNSKKYFQQLKEIVGLPLILKPVESAASHGVFKIESENDFEIFSNYKLNNSMLYEVEEFIQGTLYHVDTTLFNGECQLASAAEDSFGNLDFKSGKIIGSLCLESNNELCQRLKDFTLKCVIALGAKNGCQHTEVFVKDSNKELVFLESAARSPGLDISRMIHETYGISPGLVELHHITKIPPPVKDPYPTLTHCFIAYIPKEEGEILSFNEPKFQSPYELTWYVKIGDELAQAESLVDVAGRIFVKNDNRAIIESDFEYMKNYKSMNLKRENKK